MSNLYLLVVGVDSDTAEQKDRDWYARDAEFMRKALVSAEPFYESVHSRVIQGEEATRKTVLDALSWVEDEAGEDDVVILHFSTHGDLDAEDGFFIPLADSEEDESDNILWGYEINQAVENIRGKTIVLVDACHAGGLVTPKAALNKNAAYLVACQIGEESYGQWERPDRPHGYFVIAACEALKGLAQSDPDQIVTFQDFSEYVSTRAKEFCEAQNAVVVSNGKPGSIPMAKVDSEHTIQQLWTATPNSRRNPFGLRDVPAPLGKDVAEFSKNTFLKGDGSDPNAKPWNEKRSSPREWVDGFWESRWKEGGKRWSTGQAQIITKGKRAFIRFWEEEAEYLIEARQEGKDRLVGRYLNLGYPEDTTPWTAKIVSPERIDGAWEGGRWDFRRKLQ
ncbi:MAG: caspase domain-containing protein [Desulfococcaceae bacterium]